MASTRYFSVLDTNSSKDLHDLVLKKGLMSVWIVTGVLKRNQLTSTGNYRSFGGDFVVFQLKVAERKENILIFISCQRGTRIG